MNGPWMDYQQPEAAPAPEVAEAAPPGPWQDFAPPEQAAPATPPPLSSQQIQEQLTTMMGRAAPAEEIAGFMSQYGRPTNPEDMDWLMNDYEQARLSGAPQRRSFVVNEATAEREKTGVGEAVWAGVKSGALRGFDDEWQAFWGATGNKIGSALGLNESTADFGDIYDTLNEEYNADKDQAWEDQPAAFSVGYVPGALTGPSFVRASGGDKVGRVRRAANVAGAEGFISAAGNSEGNIIERLPNATLGGVTGYTLGGLIDPAIGLGGGVVTRVKERLGYGPARDTADSGLEALARRADLDPAAMEARAQELGDLGFDDVRLLDLLDDNGRGVVSAATGRGTPANADFGRFADEVYSNAQDRVAGQAERVISDSPVSAPQIAATTGTLRDDTIERAIAPVRAQPVPMNDEIIGVLNTREGVAALRAAQGFMTDPADRAAVDNVLSAVRAAQQIDPAIPPAIQDQIRQQIFQDANITVDIADKFARAMKGRGSEVPGLQRVATQFANTVRDAARSTSDEYAGALDNYADASTVIDAASGAGRFEDTNFLRSRPEQLADGVDRAAATGPNFIDDAGEFRTGTSEAEALRVRARDDVANRAREGSGAQAMSTARQISTGSNQRRRNAALLGAEGADNLQRGMAAEVNRVDATRYVDPRVGSQTARRLQEQESSLMEDTAIETAASAGFSPVWTIVRSVGKFLRNTGIRNADAERLVRDVIDPARTQDALAYLIQRGMPKSDAQQTVRMIQKSFTDGRLQGRLAGELSGDDQKQAPGSIRSINTRRRIEN